MMSSVEPMSSRSGLWGSAPILVLETPALRPLRGGAYEQPNPNRVYIT